MKAIIEVPKYVLTVLNQAFEIERRLSKLDDLTRFSRPLEKLKEAFDSDEAQFVIENPINQKYEITRTDVEATIAGTEHEGLIITEVLKPIIKWSSQGVSRIIQKGVVIASTCKTPLQ
ncbi:MAG: hypothetical protein U1F71_25305 [Verrucomicrobiaceae bacterium]